MHAEVAQARRASGAPRGSSPTAAPGRRGPPRRCARRGGRRHPRSRPRSAGASRCGCRCARARSPVCARWIARAAATRGVGPVERGRELVAVAVDLAAAGRGECRAHAAAVAPRASPDTVAELLDEPRRPLDVGEQEGHAHRAESTSLSRVDGFDGLDGEACRVRERMVEHVHRVVRGGRELERLAGAPVAHRHGQPVGPGVPEERDGDAVVLALCKFLFHDAILSVAGLLGNAARRRLAVRLTAPFSRRTRRSWEARCASRASTAEADPRDAERPGWGAPQVELRSLAQAGQGFEVNVFRKLL